LVIAARRSLCLLDEGPVAEGRMRPPSGRALCAQLRGYSKAIFATSARKPVEECAARPPGAGPSRGSAEENVVMSAIGRYIARANPPAGPGPAALRHTPASSASYCRPRRVAAPGDADRMYQAGVFADATPTEEFRDVMVPNAPDLKAIRFFPHSTASPAGRSEAGLAARLGVLPQCRSACLSMPPTPRKPG
jgi:hypothetical protein